MNQLSLLDDIPEKLAWLKDEIAFSLSFNQDKILRDIIRLYNDGQAFDVDCTYSKGVMWRNVVEPTFKFDLDPQVAGVVKASADNLPLEAESVGSIFFDPPFKASKSKVKGIIEERFTAFSSIEQLWQFYHRSLAEFWRVLEPGGIVAVKCQDTVSGSKNYFSHFEIESSARALGFIQLDLFVLGSKSIIMSPNMHNQQHARKNHSFILVFQREPVRKTRS